MKLLAGDTEGPVDALNQAANDRLGVLAARLSGKWTDLAEQAEAEGDLASAAVARERAAIEAVTGDALQMLHAQEAASKAAQPPTDEELDDEPVAHTPFEF